MNRKPQPAEPRGPIGALLGHIMRIFNRGDNERALRLLDIRPTDRVLEVGCGPGQLVEMLVQHASKGFVAAIDPSEVMVRQARHRNARDMELGRVEVRHGAVSQLPFGDESFDKLVAVHRFQFWPNPPGDLRELMRVLRLAESWGWYCGACIVREHPRP